METANGLLAGKPSGDALVAHSIAKVLRALTALGRVRN
jgi:hypothetical protein